MESETKLFHRHLVGKVQEALSDTPVVFVRGPRQAGKTTLVRQLVEGNRRYLTLDDPSVLLAARNDPMGLIRGMDKAVIDQVQRAPGLLLAIKRLVDEDRRPGRFLLTGSATLTALPTVADSLAGRMETLTLLPLSQSEIDGCSTNWLDLLFSELVPQRASPGTGADLETRVLGGGYPAALARPSPRRRTAWIRQYQDALLQRDVRDIAALDKIGQLPRLLRALAHMAGQLCNFSQLAGQIGIDHKTAQKYLAVFENLFLLKRVEAWSGNHLSRLVKGSKVHFLDSGLLSVLLHFSASRMPPDGRNTYGRILETFVHGEILKQTTWADGEYRLMYFRDKDQNEVDFVLESSAGALVGLEIKAAASVNRSDLAGLQRFRQVAGKAFHRGLILYDGEETLPLGDGLWAAPLETLWNLKENSGDTRWQGTHGRKERKSRPVPEGCSRPGK